MIVPARECHVCHLLTAGLRAADIEEVRAASGLPPEAALRFSFRSSSRVWVALNERGRAWTMFGVAPYGDGTTGVPWLLATDEAQAHRKFFMRNTKQYVEAMGADYTRLINYVDVRHKESLRWLKWAGFTFDPAPVLLGPESRPFLRFSKET